MNFKNSIRVQNTILVFWSVLIVSVDQLSKMWAGSIKSPVSFLFFTFEKYYNPGISFGQFSTGSPFIRVVFLSVFFGVILLLSTIFLFYFLNRTKLFWLRFSLVTFVSGIMGNGFDRIILGKVVDFVIMKPIDQIVFNIADVFLAFGALSSIYLFFKLGDVIWHEEDKRRFKIINASFQYRFSFKLVMLTFFSNLLMAIFSYTVISILISNEEFKDEVTSYIVLGFLAIVTLFSVIAFIFGIFISHRHTGPIYAFRRFLNSLSEGDDPSLRLRELDEHKELEEIAKVVREKFTPRND